ncbi:MAG TPA: DUF427 domain-containing protein [Caldithrix abyssi]|uniref:DUF427 domain-containing protein n=1 Tax=Caldithrix abyssi TaxID=187145 RepID=A0A7V4WTP4_CALAY|nr:DUF427 domain-containing protein [Caldithrix abyssi]
MKAIWKGKIIAESDHTVNIENNHYFPPETVNTAYLRESSLHTVCPWKGTASYYDVIVDGKVNKNAAWYYSEPSKAAQPIKGYIAFWHGVKVEE